MRPERRADDGRRTRADERRAALDTPGKYAIRCRCEAEAGVLPPGESDSELVRSSVELARRDRAALHRDALRNITSKLPERHHREVKTRYWVILDEATSASDAKAGLLALAGSYRRAYPAAMKKIDEHVEQLVAHLRFPLDAEPAAYASASTTAVKPARKTMRPATERSRLPSSGSSSAVCGTPCGSPSVRRRTSPSRPERTTMLTYQRPSNARRWGTTMPASAHTQRGFDHDRGPVSSHASCTTTDA